LACLTKPGDYCLKHPGEQWIINQYINTNVIDWWLNFQNQSKLISIGTSLSYPEGKSLIEENYLVGQPSDQAFVYAMSKRMLQVGIEAINKQYALNYLTIVSSAVFGPNYYVGRKEQHFIYDLIKKVLDFKYQKKDIVIWGDGYQYRDLYYINDFVNTLLTLDSVCENNIVNVGSGKGHTIRDYLKIICEYLEVDCSIVKYDEQRYSGSKKRIMDTNKLDSLIKNRKDTSLREGILLTINWMKNQYYKFE